MRLRKEQIHEFDCLHFADFRNRLLAHLRKHHSDKLSEFSDGNLHAYIEECVKRADRLYGLDTEQAVACYAELPLILGDDFEINPKYATIPALLERRSFEPNARAKIALAMAYEVASTSIK